MLKLYKTINIHPDELQNYDLNLLWNLSNDFTRFNCYMQ